MPSPCGRLTEYLPIVAVAITQEIPRSRVPREGLQQLLGRNQENLGMMALQPGENPPVDAKVHNFSYSLNGIRWPAERPYGLGPIEQAGYGDQPVVQ